MIKGIDSSCRLVAVVNQWRKEHESGKHFKNMMLTTTTIWILNNCNQLR